jgi:hypothetical protein
VENKMRVLTLCFKRVVLLLLFAPLLLPLAGCKTHSPQAAREVAIDFLTALYARGNIEEALTFCNADFKKNRNMAEFAAAVERSTEAMGRLQGFSPLEYIVDYKDDYVVIRYAGVGEKKMLYYEVTLLGTKNGGYRVSAMIETEKPFKPFRTGKKFTQ